MRALKIGTRGSPLALAQARTVQDRLLSQTPSLSETGLDIQAISTTGDQVLDRPLAEIGGKGLFSKEIDRALLNRQIDVAVHSCKDLETHLPKGIRLAGVLEREDPRDALICADPGGDGQGLDALKKGAVLGTSSIRRQAQLLHRRPDLKIVLFRGNVDTRLKKLANGDADATLLAIAGLNRLGKGDRATEVIGAEDLLPAVGQGAIAITCRADDDEISDLLDDICDWPTETCISAERAMLEALDGSCHTPIGGLAEVGEDGDVWLRGLVAAPDGSRIEMGERRGLSADARDLGLDLGAELKARSGGDLFGTWEPGN